MTDAVLDAAAPRTAPTAALSLALDDGAAHTLVRRARLRRSRRLANVSAGVVIALVTLVHLVGVADYPALADDEGTYAAQAWAVRAGELAHYTYWYDHPPLGWIQLGLLDWVPQALLPGWQPVAASRLVVALAATLSAVLIWLIGRRLGLGPVFATAAVLLACLSPLSITLQRQVYLDNLATPWVLLAFWLALDRRQRLWWHVLAGGAFGVAVLTKETTVVLLPLLCWAIHRHAHPRIRTFSMVGVIGATALVSLYYPLMALLRGELWPGAGHVSLIGALLFQFVDRTGTGAVWQAGSGSRQVVQSWLYYDPWLVVLGLTGLVFCLFARRTRLVALALLVIVLVALKPGGYLPAMYIIIALPLLGLTAAAGLQLAWHLMGRRLTAVPRLPRVIATHTGSAALLLVAAGLAVSWSPGIAAAMTTRTNDERAAAQAWMATHVSARSVVLTDDVTWLGLVRDHPERRDRVIWFYKIDTDSGVQKLFPGGWRDVDYVFSTNEMRLAVSGNPALRTTAAAIAHSRVVASFGSGSAAVEVREVSPSSTGSSTLSPSTGPASPTTSSPTTASPTTASPTTAPTTGSPTTGSPTTAPTPAPGGTAAPTPTEARTAPPPFTVAPARSRAITSPGAAR